MLLGLLGVVDSGLTHTTSPCHATGYCPILINSAVPMICDMPAEILGLVFAKVIMTRIFIEDNCWMSEKLLHTSGELDEFGTLLMLF